VGSGILSPVRLPVPSLRQRARPPRLSHGGQAPQGMFLPSFATASRLRRLRRQHAVARQIEKMPPITGQQFERPYGTQSSTAVHNVNPAQVGTHDAPVSVDGLWQHI